jgi:hypothetical protein
MAPSRSPRAVASRDARTRPALNVTGFPPDFSRRRVRLRSRHEGSRAIVRQRPSLISVALFVPGMLCRPAVARPSSSSRPTRSHRAVHHGRSALEWVWWRSMALRQPGHFIGLVTARADRRPGRDILDQRPPRSRIAWQTTQRPAIQPLRQRPVERGRFSERRGSQSHVIAAWPCKNGATPGIVKRIDKDRLAKAAGLPVRLASPRPACPASNR